MKLTLSFLSSRFSTWPISQDKILIILRTKRAFKVNKFHWNSSIRLGVMKNFSLNISYFHRFSSTLWSFWHFFVTKKLMCSAYSRWCQHISDIASVLLEICRRRSGEIPSKCPALLVLKDLQWPKIVQTWKWALYALVLIMY